MQPINIQCVSLTPIRGYYLCLSFLVPEKVYNEKVMAKAKLNLEQTEQQLPELAGAATNSAYRRALRAGSVVVYRNGELQQVTAGGKIKLIRKLAARPRIAKGSKFEIGPAKA